MTASWDAVVVGAGPAGLAAATLLAGHDARVLVLDEQDAPGGQIYRAVERRAGRAHPVAGVEDARGAALVAGFRRCGAAYLPGSAVWQVTPDRTVWWSRNGRSEGAQAGVLILAAGAMERPVPVRGWTLPGVMTAGALQILLKSSLLVPAKGPVLAGSGPLLWLLARQLLSAGAPPAAVLDTSAGADHLAALRHLPAALRGQGARYLFQGLATMGAVQRAGVPVHRGVTEIRIEGATQAESVLFRSGGRTRRLPARLIAVHEGVIPAQQITRALGCDHVWDEAQRCFRPRGDAWGNLSLPGVLVAGDLGGIGGARAAEHGGRLAALEALRLLGRLDAARRDELAAPDLRARDAHMAVRGFLDRLYRPRAEILRPADDVIVCRCEGVTAGAIRATVTRGCLGPNQAKAFLRAGMGPCQGRLCGPVVSEIIAGVRGTRPEEVGYYRIRPPLKPVTLGELAALEPSA